MKKILVLQFRTDKSLKHERGVLAKAAGLKESDFEFINILGKNPELPAPKDLKNYSGLILGGSGEFYISNWSKEIKSKIVKIKPLVKHAIMGDFPTLGICFGHQLFAELLGGKVEADEKQSEAGTVLLAKTRAGQKSEFLKGIPEKFYAVVGHKDSVTIKPKGAMTLAKSQKCKFHIFKIKNNIYSVQFHPELDKSALLWRLGMYPSYTKGESLKEVAKKYHAVKHAPKVIKNFIELL